MTKGMKMQCFLQCLSFLSQSRQNVHFIIHFIRNLQYISRFHAQDRKKPLNGIIEFLTTEASYLPLKHLLLATIGYQSRLMIGLIPCDTFSL